MPIYDFICKKCGNKFDKLVGFDWRAAGVNCPECATDDIVKAVSLVGGFRSGGKMQSFAGDTSCNTCHTGACNTCH